MKKLALLFALTILFFQSFATHLSSSVIFYDNLGGGTYEVHFLHYIIDYYPSNTNFTINSDHPSFPTLSLQLQSVNQVDFPCSDSTKMIVAHYSGTVNFGSIPTSGITLYHDGCCRQTGILNLLNPAQQGMYSYTKIYGSNGFTRVRFC